MNKPRSPGLSWHQRFASVGQALVHAAGALLGLGGIVVLWAGLFHAAASQREEAMAGARLNSQNLSRAFEETTNRTFRSIDQLMLFLREAYRQDPTGFDSVAWARATQSITDITFQVSRIDRNGILATSNLAPSGNRIDLSDREHFRAQRDSTADVLFVSKPVLGRASHKWSIQLTRKIFAADGSFDGVFVVSLDPNYLSRFYDRVDLGHAGMVVLAGTDGVIRAAAFGGHIGASGATAAPELGRSLAPGPLMDALARAPSGTLIGTSGVDNTMRVESYREVRGLPLFVVVGVALDDVLAVYDRNLRRDAMFAAVLTVMLLAVIGVLWRREARLLRTREALTASETLSAATSRVLEATLEAMSQGIVMVDADRHPQVINQRAIEFLGLEAGDIDGERLLSDMAGTMPGHTPGDFDAIGMVQQAGRTNRELVTERRLDNGVLLEVRTRALPDGGMVQTYTDITARAAAEEMLGLAAGQDQLTGLGNRNGFAPKLEQALASAQRLGLPLHVICLDLDHFKQVNDTHGHATGDLLLKAAAQRMRDELRTTDLIARLGGDEFAIVLIDQTADTAGHVAQKLIDVLSRPFLLDGQAVRVGASIGIASYPTDGTMADALLRTADIALYQSKSAGRNAWRMYACEDGLRERERSELQQDVRVALDTLAFTLVYQPICDIVTGRAVCFEALLRWNHPTRGLVPPSEFIPIAEEIGLIDRLNRWIIETACADAALWPAPLGVSVNISPVWFRAPDLLGHTQAVLARSGLAATRLGFEVTEGALLDETVAVVQRMHELRRMGVKLVLDDFGSARESLSYLRGFPFDEVKIDRSFMQALNSDRQARSLVEAMLGMCHALGLSVVAEGVETQEQLTLLRHLSCDCAQGFLIGAPIAANAVLAWQHNRAAHGSAMHAAH